MVNLKENEPRKKLMASFHNYHCHLETHCLSQGHESQGRRKTSWRNSTRSILGTYSDIIFDWWELLSNLVSISETWILFLVLSSLIHWVTSGKFINLCEFFFLHLSHDAGELDCDFYKWILKSQVRTTMCLWRKNMSTSEYLEMGIKNLHF